MIVIGEFDVVIILLLKSLAKSKDPKTTDVPSEINQGDNLFIKKHARIATLH
jgi:hypothetical protein